MASIFRSLFLALTLAAIVVSTGASSAQEKLQPGPTPKSLHVNSIVTAQGWVSLEKVKDAVDFLNQALNVSDHVRFATVDERLHHVTDFDKAILSYKQALNENKVVGGKKKDVSKKEIAVKVAEVLDKLTQQNPLDGYTYLTNRKWANPDNPQNLACFVFTKSGGEVSYFLNGKACRQTLDFQGGLNSPPTKCLVFNESNTATVWGIQDVPAAQSTNIETYYQPANQATYFQITDRAK